MDLQNSPPNQLPPVRTHVLVNCHVILMSRIFTHFLPQPTTVTTSSVRGEPNSRARSPIGVVVHVHEAAGVWPPQEAGVWSLHKAAGDRRTKRTSRRWCFATRRAWARQLRLRSRLCWLLFRLRLRLLFRLRMRLLFHSRLRLLTTLRSLLVFLALQWDSTCGIEGARDPRERMIPPLLTMHARTTRLENVGCVSSLTCQLEHKCLRSSALRIHPTPWWSSGMRPIGKGRGNTV